MVLRESSLEHWEESKFRAVFSQYYARIVGILANVLGERSSAEDVANDAFWRLYRQPALQADGNVGGWLYRTATNLGIDALRAANRRRQYEEASIRTSPASHCDGPLENALREEKRRKVRRVLSRIKPAQAQLLILRSNGFSYKELAESLNVKASGVGTMLNRAEEEFRAQYLTLHSNQEEL